MIKFDQTRCSNCGACISVCTKGVIKPGDKTPVEGNPQACSVCGHCIIACNSDAISHEKIPATNQAAYTPGAIDPELVAQFLKSKRSVRKYEDRPIEHEKLEKIFEVVRYAPTAKNLQDRSLIVVTDRKKIEEMDRAVCQSFKKLLRVMNWPVRKLLGLSMPALIRSLEPKLPSLRNLVARSERGEFPVFYNAPCVVFTTGTKGNSLAKDNAVIAQQYLTLQAQAMGIDSCIIGYAAVRIKSLTPLLDIPAGHQVITATTLGYSKSSFKKLPPRKPIDVRWC